MEQVCKLCPRLCGVVRGETGRGACGRGEAARIARAALHFWEEPPISGKRGSGTVFFTGCALGCAYCQNYEISKGENLGKEVSPQELSRIFQKLEDQGAHNINLVTPSHFIPAIREALLVKNLSVPVVFNSSGYELASSLKKLEGLVNIYLPDFKYAQPELAGALSHAPDYPQIALEAIGEMVRQVGPPEYDGEGMMKKGVLVRHLILPGHTKNSIEALSLLKSHFPGIPVSLMAQYTPCREVGGFPELSRPITRRELEKVENALFDLGLDGFVQSRAAKGAQYIPDFHQFKEG